MPLTPRAPSTAVERASCGRLGLPAGELLRRAFKDLRDRPLAVAFRRGVCGDAQFPFDAANVVEVGDVAGEALVGVGAFEGDEADAAAGHSIAIGFFLAV